MIRFDKVTKIYSDNTYAARDLSLHIRPAEFVSIVGQSGTGKTTLAKMVIAEERPSKGRVIIGSWDITAVRSADIPVLRRQVGMVFQDFKLLPKKTVYENVAFALEVCGVNQGHINRIVPQVLKVVGLNEKRDKFPHQLSGGQRQRVAIGRALVHRPKVLVADEPTGNLDTINAQEIIELLLKINTLGTTIMLVTHNKDIVNRLRKRVISIDDGTIVSDQQSGKYII
ncbi:MAG: ATP-binding cassette domain-containing protein [Candidatus Kerfeldbacteria bacterium]|nr:ATP-binding cassette domain-containing protein [Candidatus Kerfeldbacteria bacterium]